MWLTLCDDVTVCQDLVTFTGSDVMSDNLRLWLDACSEGIAEKCYDLELIK